MRWSVPCSMLAACCAVTTAAADDWLGRRGPDRAHRSAETGLFDSWDEDGRELLWTAEGVGNGDASVSVRGDRAYTSGNFGDSQSVVAVETRDGSTAWKTPITGAPIRLSPTANSTSASKTS